MSENHTMSQIRHALHSMCSRVLKPMISRALHPMCSQLPNISRSITTSAPRLVLTLSLMLASVGAWAQTNANYVPFEFYTSINQITGNFAIVNAAEGKALYGPDAQNIGYADYATAFANNRAVTQYALENAGNGNYRLRCVTPAGGNYGLWGSNPCYLNAQDHIDGVIFNLGLNNQNGQDVRNGALWKLNYVEGNGWTIQNVAHNGYAAPNNTTRTQPYYWQLCSLADNSFATNNYVFFTGTYYQGSSTTGVTTFNPSTCIWQGNSGGTFQNGSGYHLYRGTNNNSTYYVTNDGRYNSNCTLFGTENGTTGQKIQINTNANGYLRYNNGWTTGNNNNGGTVVFKVTRNILSTQIKAPTLSGADQIDQLGNSTYTRTDASYQPACYDYVFYNGADHYCTSVTANATATRPSETFTYTWSLLNEDGTAYTGANVSVDNNGVVNYKTIFSSDTRLTLRLTATSDSKTFTADKAITFKGSCTTPTITFSQSTKTVTISGKTGETIHYTTDDGYSGAAPTAGSPTYSAPINITQRTRIRAIATKANYRDSEVASLIVDNPNSMTPSTTYIGNVTAGNTVQLSYTLSGQPDADVIYDRVVYSSENSTVASVDQTGLVSAKVAGTTNIVMTLYNLDGTVKATQQIGIVVKNPFNDPSSLSVNSIDQSVNVGGTWQIVATAYGEDPVYQKFKYEVTGTSGIASVDATGLVTGLAEGTTQITVTAYNYGDVLSTLTQTINITVVKTEYIDGKKCIYSLDDIDNVNGSYILMQDITASNGLNITFSGTLDGDYHTINGLTSPLFTRLNGATVKNVILDNVKISGARTVNSVACLGAIACYAEGSTKIYNCGVQASGSTFDEKGNPVNNSSTISGGNNTGSLVGYIPANSNVRVVNNYSYANVSGASYVGGIVGRNAGTALANNNYTNTSHTAIVLNMFYGDLRGTQNVSPVYAGNHTSNVQNVNEYNYWRSRANVSYNNYNNQLAVDKNEFLNRFPFYRHILNTHRELAAIYLFGSRTDANVAEIGHWYNTKNKPDGLGGINNPTPYPIIEVWKTNTKRTTEDIKNNLPNTGNEYEGNLITAADRSGKTVGSNGYLRVNWSVHGKSGSIDLPITDMDSLNYDFTWGKVVLPFATELAEKNTYTQICTGWKITGITGGTTGTLANYDFADRDCTTKDLFANSGYIFAQGGNYIVPYGVTAISIEGNMATAFYLRDGSYDIGYDANYANATAVAGNITGQYHGQNVYTNLGTLLDAMGTASDPHQQAIVLVGNFHYNQNALGGNIFGSRTTKGLTIMSVDEDNNQEPDYGWYSYHTTDRTDIAPVRFDFVPNIGIGMAARTTGSTPYPTIGIWHGHGWFELTETCVSFMSECEINSYSFNVNDNGKGNNRWIANSGYFIQIVRARDGNCTKLSYIQIGGNAYVEQLYPGSHTDQARNVTIRPIIVNGGEIEECYMTGYKAGATATGENIYFWSAGGKMHKWLGAYAENPNTAGVNVTAKIDHAIIGRFFGGGTSTSALIKGNIDITMNNSFVNFYCGGPEFGDMGNGKTVTTHANGTIFGEYYGGGFGGTSITINREAQTSGVNFGTDKEYDLAFTNYTSHRLQNGTYGIGVNYDFEYILYSGGGGTGVSRFYTGYANYSLAQTGNVTNVLENCTVLRDYFGGGCQGKVAGTVTSTLTNCDVMGSAFGGGYKPAETTVDVYPTTQPTYSRYTKETGLFSDFGTVAPETYTWVQRATSGSDAGRKELYTTVNMSESGRVTGAISITVDGGSVGHNVYGGGNESPSDDATTVLIKGGAQVGQDAFGGGNIAPVGKDVSITLGVAGVADASDVAGAIYGGGALANTNTTSGNTTVNLYGGSVTDVYGGGLGSRNGVNGATEDIAAIVNGNTTVTLDGSIIRGNIFGANNVNGTPKGHVFVDVKTTVAKGTEDEEHPYHVLGVYGGGNLAAYVPTDANGYAEVLIEKCDNSIEDVFGGGNAAAVPATEVTVWGGQIGRVFAGGNGSSAPADVTNNTHAIIHGGTIKEVYGGSNSQGAIGGTIKVDVAELKKPENQDLCPINITDLYGGGNQADSKAGLLNIGKCSHIGSVYGGANKANIEGNIELNIIDGHIDNVFGGNNNSGQVNGNITVNVNWDAGVNAENANVGNVYGGGNIASIDNGTPRTVTVNIPNATISGSVFGGGKGKPAVIVGNTNVNIGVWSNTANAIVNGDVFGGGDLAAVEGDCNVTIRDCNTLITGDLYGGGNAAPVYSTNTTLWGGTVAGNVFGGGNGKDATKNANGAQVGYARNDETPGGSGVATTNIYGGTVGTWTTTDGVESCGAGTGGVFGGSNTNGNIRGNISLLLDERACDETDAVPCDLKLKDIYGAGNEAAYAGTGISFNLGCVSYLSEIYGGAKAADLNSDAILTITSGRFGKVFGGNNVSGKLNGKIVVTVDETGCHPVIIDELYGGGNLAAYSVYGYEDELVDGKVVVKTSGDAQPDPVVNIISCTSIGTVYGGGYGATAVMVGSPTVNINMIPGDHAVEIDSDGDGTADNDATRIGTIETVYGGGNAASVVGNTSVNVGTLAQNAHLQNAAGTVNITPVAVGANITGNVYGGGNAADVTGKTNVMVGRD